MARQVTIKAFEEWIKDEANVELVLESVAGGLTLQKAALAVKKPYTCLHQYFHSSPEKLARYDAARKAWADSKMDEALEIADDVKADQAEVAKAKLRVEVRQNQAKAYNRERWGERLQVDKNVSVSADAALIGTVAQLLLSGKKRPAVTVENAPGQASDVQRVGAEPPPARLPAPAERG
jgi:hypothetical protein